MKRFAIAALSLFILGATAGSALAQFDRSDVYDTPVGSIYVSPFPDSYYGFFQLFPTFQAQNVYIVADIDFGDIGAASQNLTNGIRAWEGGVTAPSALTILSADVEGAINLGQGNLDYIVGIGTPIITADSTPRPLVTLSMLALNANWETFNMEIIPSSSPAFAATPTSVWIEQLTLNGCLNIQSNLPTQCFFVWESTGSMLISPDIAVEDESFGGLKARFDR